MSFLHKRLVIILSETATFRSASHRPKNDCRTGLFLYVCFFFICFFPPTRAQQQQQRVYKAIPEGTPLYATEARVSPPLYTLFIGRSVFFSYRRLLHFIRLPYPRTYRNIFVLFRCLEATTERKFQKNIPTTNRYDKKRHVRNTIRPRTQVKITYVGVKKRLNNMHVRDTH